MAKQLGFVGAGRDVQCYTSMAQGLPFMSLFQRHNGCRFEISFLLTPVYHGMLLDFILNAAALLLVLMFVKQSTWHCQFQVQGNSPVMCSVPRTKQTVSPVIRLQY